VHVSYGPAYPPKKSVDVEIKHITHHEILQLCKWKNIFKIAEDLKCFLREICIDMHSLIIFLISFSLIYNIGKNKY